jgi:hypothetical protein
MQQFLWGTAAMGCWVAGLFFLRFWRTSLDRLFLFFGAAFWVFGLNWVWLAVANVAVESRHQVYLLRLVAFALIILGIVDKNRRTKRDEARREQGSRLGEHVR